ncbi:MAG TPA: zinc ribbon domain-containing protein [Pseudolysinimonas sp.]|nr:zinc ribbon domain-containing protein [Pseudolysinimonas sp.]
MKFPKPVPQPDVDTAPFWSACGRGALIGQRCGACGLWRWPPRSHCPSCHAASPVWESLAGTGTIVALVTFHRAFDPSFLDDIPLTVIHAVLDGTDEQMVLQADLRPGETGARIGSRLRVVFDAVNGMRVPAFTLLDSKGSNS